MGVSSGHGQRRGGLDFDVLSFDADISLHCGVANHTVAVSWIGMEKENGVRYQLDFYLFYTQKSSLTLLSRKIGKLI